MEPFSVVVKSADSRTSTHMLSSNLGLSTGLLLNTFVSGFLLLLHNPDLRSNALEST